MQSSAVTTLEGNEAVAYTAYRLNEADGRQFLSHRSR